MIKNVERKQVFTELAKGERVYQLREKDESIKVLNYEPVDIILDDLQNSDDFEYFMVTEMESDEE